MTYQLQAGALYYFVSDDKALDEMENNIPEETPGFSVILGFLAIFLFCLVVIKRRR